MVTAVAVLQRSSWWWRRACAGLCVAATMAACNQPAVLTQLVDARRLAPDIRVQFTKAVDAANRAVLADTDDASSAAAREAEQAMQAVQRDIEQLEPILRSLGFPEEIRHLDGFKARLAEYQTLEREILSLDSENTNLKAYRLSFGPAQEAADSFRDALGAAERHVTPTGACCVEALVAQARVAVLEIQVLEARHIPESDEAAMSRMEASMAASEAAAHKALNRLKALLPPAAAAQLAAAAAALDRFAAVHAELVTLSRRNSNVKSLALSLGRKRMLTALCDETLSALQDALARHESTATR